MSAATETSLQEIAKEYQQLGLCAIPVEGKRPLIPWRPFVERFPTEEEWRSFPWSAATGLALVIGPATWELWPNLWCLDIEAEHRSDAEAWLDRYVPDWRAGAVVETGSGGLHVYFLADSPVRTKPIPWGEVRGQASICVLPPSKHPETGRPYLWLSQRWSNLPLLDPGRIPGVGNGYQLVRELLSGTIPIGQRNIVLTKAAGLLRGELGLSADELLTVLRTLNTRCEEPLPERELQAIARSAQRWPQNPQLVISSNGHKLAEQAWDSTVTAKRVEAWTPVPITQLQGEDASVDWLWSGFLARGHISDLVGLWKSGKTTLLTTLLHHMGSGGELAGRTIRPGTALVVSEEPKALWSRRCAEFSLGDHTHLIVRPFARRPSMPDWLAFVDHLTNLVRQQHYDLVVFDSLPNLWGVTDENDAAQVIAALLPLQQLASAGCGVLLVRHPRKSGGSEGTAGRGSGAISGFVDFLIEMRRFDQERLDDPRRILTVYSRYEPFEVVIRWNGGAEYETLGSPAEYSAEAQREQIIAVLADSSGLTTEEVARSVELPHATTSRRLNELLQAGRVQRHGSGKRGDPYRWSLAEEFVSPTRECAVGEKKPGSPETGLCEGPSFVSPTSGPLVGETKDDQKPDNPHHEANCPVFGQFVSPTKNSSVGEKKNGGKPDISHHDAKCPVFDHVADTKAFGVNNGKPDIFDHEAKIALCEPAVVTEKPDIFDHDAKIALCEVCGRPVTWSGRGKPVRYCSDACRKRAQRKGEPGQRSENGDQRVPIVNVNDVNSVNVNDRPEWVHCNPEELDDEAVIALCQRLLAHGPLPDQLDIPGGRIFDPHRFLTTQLASTKGTGYVAQIARHHLRTFLRALWSGDSSQHPESLAITTEKSQATVPSHGTPGHSPHQGGLAGDQATVPSDEGPRCPVCGEVYQLRTTARPGWLQIRCKCRPPGEWWWVRADDPALGRKGVTQHGSG